MSGHFSISRSVKLCSFTKPARHWYVYFLDGLSLARVNPAKHIDILCTHISWLILVHILIILSVNRYVSSEFYDCTLISIVRGIVFVFCIYSRTRYDDLATLHTRSRSRLKGGVKFKKLKLGTSKKVMIFILFYTYIFTKRSWYKGWGDRLIAHPQIWYCTVTDI